MGIIVDVVLVAAIGLSVFLGYKEGLVGVAFKILSFVIALVLAFALSAPVSNIIIENTQIDDNIRNTIEKTIASKEQTEISKEESNDVSSVITDYVANEIKQATAETQDKIAVTVAESLTGTIIRAMSFIGIFLVARIVLFFLKFLADALAELPIVKQFNEAGGILYGILRGFFVIYLLLAILSLLATVFDFSGILGIIDTSFIGKILYNNNLLLRIFF